MLYPFMPNLKEKSTDEIVKEMNDLYVKLRIAGGMNNQAVMQQLRSIISEYQNEYTLRLQEAATKQSTPKKPKTGIQND